MCHVLYVILAAELPSTFLTPESEEKKKPWKPNAIGIEKFNSPQSYKSLSLDESSPVSLTSNSSAGTTSTPSDDTSPIMPYAQRQAAVNNILEAVSKSQISTQESGLKSRKQEKEMPEKHENLKPKGLAFQAVEGSSAPKSTFQPIVFDKTEVKPFSRIEDADRKLSELANHEDKGSAVSPDTKARSLSVISERSEGSMEVSEAMEVNDSHSRVETTTEKHRDQPLKFTPSVSAQLQEILDQPTNYSLQKITPLKLPVVKKVNLQPTFESNLNSKIMIGGKPAKESSQEKTKLSAVQKRSQFFERLSEQSKVESRPSGHSNLNSTVVNGSGDADRHRLEKHGRRKDIDLNVSELQTCSGDEHDNNVSVGKTEKVPHRMYTGTVTSAETENSEMESKEHDTHPSQVRSSYRVEESQTVLYDVPAKPQFSSEQQDRCDSVVEMATAIEHLEKDSKSSLKDTKAADSSAFQKTVSENSGQVMEKNHKDQHHKQEHVNNPPHGVNPIYEVANYSETDMLPPPRRKSPHSSTTHKNQKKETPISLASADADKKEAVDMKQLDVSEKLSIPQAKKRHAPIAPSRRPVSLEVQKPVPKPRSPKIPYSARNPPVPKARHSYNPFFDDMSDNDEDEKPPVVLQADDVPSHEEMKPNKMSDLPQTKPTYVNPFGDSSSGDDDTATSDKITLIPPNSQQDQSPTITPSEIRKKRSAPRPPALRSTQLKTRNEASQNLNPSPKPSPPAKLRPVSYAGTSAAKKPLPPLPRHPPVLASTKHPHLENPAENPSPKPSPPAPPKPKRTFVEVSRVAPAAEVPHATPSYKKPSKPPPPPPHQKRISAEGFSPVGSPNLGRVEHTEERRDVEGEKDSHGTTIKRPAPKPPTYRRKVRLEIADIRFTYVLLMLLLKDWQ